MQTRREDHRTAAAAGGAGATGVTEPRLLDRYRLLAEHTSDVVMLVDDDARFRWVSPSVHAVLGWQPAALLGTRASALIYDEDAAKVEVWLTLVYLGEPVAATQLRCRTGAGDLRWMLAHTRPRRDRSGRIDGRILVLRDCQSEVVARRALSTLSAGSKILVRADREEGLLSEMCQIAVDGGGYLLAWYGRRIDDAARSVAKIASSRELRDYVDTITVDWSDGPLGQGPTGRAIRSGKVVVIEDTLADAGYAPWRQASSEHGFRSAIALPVCVGGVIDGSLQVYAAEPQAFDEFVVGVLSDLASQLGYGLRRLRDYARVVQLTRDQTLLSTAIDQAGEAVVVTDPAGTILYANPAALRTSGYALEEVLGENPRIFQSGLQDRTFYESMWSRLLGGETWRGVVVNRRKDGELWEAESTISPIHDEDGSLVAFVSVKRDVTVLRRLEAALTQGQRDRGRIVDVMQLIRPAETLEATAYALCQAVTTLESIDSAAVLLVGDDGSVRSMASAGVALPGVEDGKRVSVADPSRLVARTSEGPWWLDLSKPVGASGKRFVTAAYELGLRAAANIPIRWEGRLIGVLTLGTGDPDAPHVRFELSRRNLRLLRHADQRTSPHGLLFPARPSRSADQARTVLEVSHHSRPGRRSQRPL